MPENSAQTEPPQQLLSVFMVRQHDTLSSQSSFHSLEGQEVQAFRHTASTIATIGLVPDLIVTPSNIAAQEAAYTLLEKFRRAGKKTMVHFDERLAPDGVLCKTIKAPLPDSGKTTLDILSTLPPNATSVAIVADKNEIHATANRLAGNNAVRLGHADAVWICGLASSWKQLMTTNSNSLVHIRTQNLMPKRAQSPFQQPAAVAVFSP